MTLPETQITNYVYVGQGGTLSTIPLQILCEKGLRPMAVIQADKRSHPAGLNLLPLRPPVHTDSLAYIAGQYDLPLIYWQRSAEALIMNKLARLAPDLVVMSCFPWRIRSAMLSVPQQGWWNLHPSLLPKYRGPAPLFWQAKAGEEWGGVSLHQVAETLDTGAVISQQAVSFIDFQGQAFEEEVAIQGASLIEQALLAVEQGTLQPQSQDESRACYQGVPDFQDRCLVPIGCASQAYRYINLVNEQYPLWLKVGQQNYIIKAALDFDDTKTIPEALMFKEGRLMIQFEQGVLSVLVEEARWP